MTRNEQVARRVRQALARYYFQDSAPEVPFEPHPFWHGPFLVCPYRASREDRRERVACSGEIWLRNKDFGWAPMLIVSDLVGKESWLFRRPRGPGERSVVAGPVAGIFVHLGPEIGFVRYAELTTDIGGEALSRLAREDRA